MVKDLACVFALFSLGIDRDERVRCLCVRTSVLIYERLVMALLYVVSSAVMAQHTDWLGAYYDRVQSHRTKSQLTPQSRLDHS